MKINQLIAIAAPLSLSLIGMTSATPSPADVNKRENTPVYIEFKELVKTLSEIETVQKETQNYAQVAYDLNVLSTTAEAAWSSLTQKGDTMLEKENVKSIGQSLKTISSKSGIIEIVAKQAKEGLTKDKAIDKFAQIVELNVFEFYTLFKELKKHVDQKTYTQYGQNMSNTLCEFVDAIQLLHPSIPPTNNDANTYCVNFKAGLRGDLSTDGFDISAMSPPGIETCGNKTTRFLDAAYSQGTLGQATTKCTDQNVGIAGNALPQNALDLPLYTKEKTN